MFRSLHMKLVLIMLLLITSLMAIVGAFLMTSITGFFIEEFYQQMDSVFGDSNPSNAAFVGSLRSWAEEEDVPKMQEMIEAKAGDLGLNSATRTYYILDGRTGAFLAGSEGQEAFDRMQATPNLLTARSGIAAGQDRVGDQSDITAGYMDVAIPITAGESAYIIYIYDNRDTVSALNGQLFLIIVQALLVGLLISVLLSFLLSKTMIIPIERLTEGAERVASGDFGSTIEVESTDEIGILTTTFNDMAAVLQDTLEAVENERNKLDTLFLHMTDGVVAFGRDGSVLHSNPAVSQMLGREVSFYDYDALFGDKFPMKKVLSLQRPDFVSGELTARERILELYLAPFSDGEDGGVMAVLHDVTAQRKNDEMRKEFVANVSHELRTPLTNVRSYAETLRDNDDVPREMENNFLDIIISEVDRMTHIVQDLLTLSPAGGPGQRLPGRGAGGPAARPHTGPLLRGDPAHGHRGPQPPGAGDDERGGQRHQVHPRRGDHHCRRGPPGPQGVDRGLRYRHRHPRAGPGAHLRPLLPGGQGPLPGERRHGPGPLHRPGDRTAPQGSHPPRPPRRPRHYGAHRTAHPAGGGPP